MKKAVQVAVIDMNNGLPNQGMRGITEILERYRQSKNIELNYSIFDIRQQGEVPDLSFDIFISSGGPGSPFDGENEKWEKDFFELLAQIDRYNHQHQQQKHVFLICHSFQLACRKYALGTVCKRRSTAFGIFPTTLTHKGEHEPVFAGLTNPFYTVDSRDWQVVMPDLIDFENKGARILAIEKERPHIDLERCIMAIRFAPYMIGTQFHPEADPIGMRRYLLQDEKKKAIVENHGESKYLDMLNSLEDPDRISLTQKTVLPNFLDIAIKNLTVKND